MKVRRQKYYRAIENPTIVVKYPKKLKEYSKPIRIAVTTMLRESSSKKDLFYKVFKKENGDLIVTSRQKGLIGLVSSLFKKTPPPQETIPQKEFEHGLNGLFYNAFKKLSGKV